MRDGQLLEKQEIDKMCVFTFELVVTGILTVFRDLAVISPASWSKGDMMLFARYVFPQTLEL